MQNLPAEKLVGLISAGEMQSGTAAAVTAPDIDLCLNLYDFEAVAKRVMKDSSFAYYATGATDEFTKQGNQVHNSHANESRGQLLSSSIVTRVLAPSRPLLSSFLDLL
eukprot:3934515-Pleurochrysis_carterae.AAC.1